jgi:predicted TIM-barrel fold metal-dependent hydrolase
VALIGQFGQSVSIVMGSDWPHAEGMAEPADYRKLLDGLPEDVKDAIMHDTGRALADRT